jgi:hypothetical protein
MFNTRKQKATGYKEPKKNFLNFIDQRALIILIGLYTIGIFFLGKFTEQFMNSKNKQTAIDQKKQIQNLQDSLIIMKLEKKNTVISLQEPMDTLKK